MPVERVEIVEGVVTGFFESGTLLKDPMNEDQIITQIPDLRGPVIQQVIFDRSGDPRRGYPIIITLMSDLPLSGHNAQMKRLLGGDLETLWGAGDPGEEQVQAVLVDYFAEKNAEGARNADAFNEKGFRVVHFRNVKALQINDPEVAEDVIDRMQWPHRQRRLGNERLLVPIMTKEMVEAIQNELDLFVEAPEKYQIDPRLELKDTVVRYARLWGDDMQQALKGMVTRDRMRVPGESDADFLVRRRFGKKLQRYEDPEQKPRRIKKMNKKIARLLAPLEMTVEDYRKESSWLRLIREEKDKNDITRDL